MAQNFYEIGPVPYGEDCEQVGMPSYNEANALKECETFKAQLLRLFPNIPASCEFRIKRNPHDFGEYMEVAIYFDDNDKESSDYAMMVEDGHPEEWDEESRAALGL